LILTAGGSTDRGKVRPSNEDAFTVSVNGQAGAFGLCVVADGMGGANAGEVASRMAVEVVRERIEGWMAERSGAVFDRELIDEAPEALAQAILAANLRIYESSRADPERAGMGTTVTAAFLVAGYLNLAHVGDSRGFLLRGGRLEQVTIDHSVVAELIRCGTLREEDAQHHPHRNVLTRAVGTDPSLAIDLVQVELCHGDALLICSDGVTRHLEVGEMRRILEASAPQAAADALVRLASDRGGLDNLTAVVVACTEAPK
jgi:protein phosphatase